MQIDFYRNTVPKNRLYRNLTGHLVSQGHLIAPCDVLNPVIKMAYNAYQVNINYYTLVEKTMQLNLLIQVY